MRWRRRGHGRKLGRTWREPDGFALICRKPGAGGNPTEPSGTRRKTSKNFRKEYKSVGFLAWPSTYFFSAGLRQVSARFPPNSAGFCRSRLHQVALDCARFREPRGFCQLRRILPGFAGFPPTRFLLPTPPSIYFFLWGYAREVRGFCQEWGESLPGVCQACGNQRSAFYNCSDIVQVSLWQKSPLRGLPFSTLKRASSH